MTAKPGPVACPADEMRVTLNGKQHLKVKKPTVFQLSLINGSGQTCIASITAKNFELKIYSGTDRIWSTNDCSTAIKSDHQETAPLSGSSSGLWPGTDGARVTTARSGRRSPAREPTSRQLSWTAPSRCSSG